MAYRNHSPIRYAPQHHPTTAMIPFLWGASSQPIAVLPQSTLSTHLPYLATSLRRGGGHPIDIRSKLVSSTTDYYNHPPERYRKAATAILQYFETLTDPDAACNPLTRFLERKVAAESQEDDGEGKTLRAVESVLHIARVFGCLPTLRLVLEHFLLTFGRQVVGYAEDWREVLSEIGCHGTVRGEIESRMNEYSTGGTENLSVGEYTRGRGGGRGFEAAVVASSPELGNVWRGSRSIFAAVSPEVLQAMLGQLGGGNTLVPPAATADGELLDTRGELVCVEIRKLETGRGGLDGRLKQRVAEWFLRGRWEGVGGGGGRREAIW